MSPLIAVAENTAQARQMMETLLSTVMPGVQWSTRKPIFLTETTTLIETWRGKVLEYLSDLPKHVDSISSRSIKKDLQAENITKDTWTRIMQAVSGASRALELRPDSSKKDLSDAPGLSWKLQGRSLVRQTPESLGFFVENA